jgi:hypothetical protein
MVISRLCKVAQIDGDVKLASRATPSGITSYLVGKGILGGVDKGDRQ